MKSKRLNLPMNALRYHSPMLATLVKEPFSRPNWIFEKKFDGERCLIVKKGEKVFLYSRNKKNLNTQYPELVNALKKQKKDFVVDGEIVAKSFSLLQKRMQRKTPIQKIPVVLHLFDILNAQGKDLRANPLIERKKELKKTISFSGKVRYVTHIKTNGLQAFRNAEKKRWEGIIAKKADAPYISKRSKDWLKFKCEKKDIFLIVGFTPPQGSRVGIGALILGYKKQGLLFYAGKVGTGFNTALLQLLAKKLKKIERSASSFPGQFPQEAHFVIPKYRCHVAFTEWTNKNRLRHPRFLSMEKNENHPPR